MYIPPPTPVFAISDDIVGLIVLAIWALGALFKVLLKNNKKEDQDPEAVEAAKERARQIQEEIRRRIREAQENAKQKAGETVQDARERARRAQQAATSRTEEPPRQPAHREQPRWEIESPWSQAESDVEVQTAMDRRMEQLRQRREELEEQARQAREKATKLAPAISKTAIGKTGAIMGKVVQRQKGADATRIIAMMRTQEGLRDAVMLSELLAPPVSERKNPSCPGW